MKTLIKKKGTIMIRRTVFAVAATALLISATAAQAGAPVRPADLAKNIKVKKAPPAGFRRGGRAGPNTEGAYAAGPGTNFLVAAGLFAGLSGLAIAEIASGGRANPNYPASPGGGNQ